MRTISIFLFLLASQAFAASPVSLYDGTGHAIGSTAGALNVSGTFTANNSAIGTTGAAVPGSASYTAGSKAGNLTGLLIGQQTMANSLACVLPSDQSAIPVSESGTWIVQPGNTANTTPWLQTISQGGNSATVTASNALKVDGSAVTQPVNVTQVGGSSLALGQTTKSASIPVTIASDQVSPKTYANSAGSFVLNASLTTVVTETAPANSVGFILEASSSNSNNIRWALGATATTTSGMRLEPGRATAFVPVAASITIVSESGTNEYELTWVKQ